MRSDLWQRIEESRSRWNVLEHPFYTRWSAGELTADELAHYSGQYRHAVCAIADMSAASAAKATGEVRDGMLRHAAEESSHVPLWDAFTEAVGGEPAADASPETAECVAAWTADDGLTSTLARLYAVESGQPEISRTKREGLLSHYGVNEGPATEYFKLHETLDHEHAAEARAVIERLGDEAGDDQLVAAAESAFKANWRLLDGVERHFGR